MERKRQQQAAHEAELAKAREEAQRDRQALERKFRGADSGGSSLSASESLRSTHSQQPKTPNRHTVDPFQAAPPQESPVAAAPPPPPPLPGGLKQTSSVVSTQETRHPLSTPSHLPNCSTPPRMGDICGRCSKSVLDASAPVDTSGRPYHSSCFICSDCSMPLTGRPFHQTRDRRLFCQECFPQSICARCGTACSPLTGGVTWQGKAYHAEHFTCVYCNVALIRRAKITDRTDEATIMTPAAVSPEGEPCCVTCEEAHRVYSCIKCHQAIPRGEHTGVKGQGPFCGSCAAIERNLHCVVCNQLIEESKWTTDAQSRVYHDKCFQCTKCQASLVGIKYYNEPSGLHCTDCFAMYLCSRCPTCNEPVLEDGTRWCEMTFHKNHFVCCVCNKVTGAYSYLTFNGFC